MELQTYETNDRVGFVGDLCHRKPSRRGYKLYGTGLVLDVQEGYGCQAVTVAWPDGRQTVGPAWNIYPIRVVS